MDRQKKNQVLEILDYWKIIEFLGQTDILEESAENKKLVKKIQQGKKTTAGKIEVFSDVLKPPIQVDKNLEEDKIRFKNYSSVGEEIDFCLGKIERNTIVDYLEKYIENPAETPELAYPKKSTIAWCSFKTDTEGLYMQGSFRLSPLLWAISVWEKHRAEKKHGILRL